MRSASCGQALLLYGLMRLLHVTLSWWGTPSNRLRAWHRAPCPRPRRERAVGGEELQVKEGTVDEEVSVELVELLDGAALAQQIMGMAGGGRRH
jgi:hypothetical protein